MDKLKNLLVFIMKNSNKSLGRTELMKYIYIFEYLYYQLYGRRFSDLQFTRYYYGPNDSQVVQATFGLHDEGIISIQEYTNYYNTTSYTHKFVMESQHDEYALPEDAELVATFVIDRLKDMKVQEVKEYSYQTPPMQEVLREEVVIEKTLLGRMLDMSKTGPIYKPSQQRKEEARQRLMAKEQVRGTDEEYYKHMVEQIQRSEETTRRASLVES